MCSRTELEFQNLRVRTIFCTIAIVFCTILEAGCEHFLSNFLKPFKILGPESSALDRKCEKLDRLVTEVQRDVKTLKKAVDSLSSQLDSQSVRERPKMASFIEEINVIKETMSVQVKN